MKPVEPDQLLAYARTLRGRRLRTLDRGSPFSVAVKGNDLWFTLLRTGTKGKRQMPYLSQFCKEFCKTKSLKTVAYDKIPPKKGIFASYTLVLMLMYLAARASGRLSSNSVTASRIS